MVTRAFLLACSLLVLVSSARAQPPADLLFQQSPPKPAPDWLKIVDAGKSDPRLKGMLVPEGVSVEIVAEEPVVINPVGMTFDNDGNLYVLEWRPAESSKEDHAVFTYKDGSKRKAWIMKKPIRDWVKVLLWNAEKKVYDKARVLIEDELPSSILVHDGWVYLTGQGTVRRYNLAEARKLMDEADKDPKAERRWPAPQVIAQGFCGFHHHQVSGLTIGNDGWLYVTSGDDDNVVEGSDGSRAVALRTGAIFRMKPDGSKVQLYSLGYRNPYRDVAFDAEFNMFHADNDNEDGSKWTGCRLVHVLEGSDYGWRLREGARCCVPDPLRSSVYGELPGKLPPLLKTGRGAPAGLLIYNDAFFPEHYRGLLYYPDVFRRLVRAYKVDSKRCSFEVTHEFELMKSSDGLFRPCQMVTGPDGAMYVCDWRTDSGGAGKLWGDGKHGRIYRLTFGAVGAEPAIKTRELTAWTGIAKAGEDELFGLLESANFTDRQKAQQEIVRRGPKMRGRLLGLLNDNDKPLHARIAALGGVQALWDEKGQEASLALVRSGPTPLRRLAIDGLALHAAAADKDVHEVLFRELEDPEPSIRRAVYLALGRVNAPGAAEALVSSLRFDDGKDAFLRDGLVRAIEYTGKAGIDKLIELTDSGEDKDLDRVLEVYPTLRTRPAGEGLARLLKKYHLQPPQLVTLIRSYSNYQLDPPLSLKSLEEYLAKVPAPKAGVVPDAKEAKKIADYLPVRLAALETLAAGGALNSDKMRGILLDMLGDGDIDVRRSVLHTIEEMKMTRAAPLLHDMLAKSTDAEERQTIVETLGTLREGASYAVLEKLFLNKESDAPLRLTAFRALAAIDARKVLPQAEKLLAAGAELDLMREAVVASRVEASSANRVGKLFLEGKLPRSLLPEVTGSLRRHSPENGDSARLLADILKSGLLLSLSSKEEIARISAEVRKRGDAVRGRELYLNNRALACITCHKLEGVGGQIGPDLTRVWETHSLEKVMEAILDPSKEIKEGYQTYQATTFAGVTYLGLKITQDDKELTLRTTTGQNIRLPVKEIETLMATKKSLMPDDVVKHLKYEEFLDLVAFLRDRERQEELRTVVEYQVIGPFPADTKKDFGPEVKLDLGAIYDGDPRLGGGKLTWQTRLSDIDGLIAFKAPARSSFYALVYVHSPKEQKAMLGVQTKAEVRLTLDGKKIVDFDAEPLVEVTLRAGATPLLIRLVGEPGDVRFRLGVAAKAALRLSGRAAEK